MICNLEMAVQFDQEAHIKQLNSQYISFFDIVLVFIFLLMSEIFEFENICENRPPSSKQGKFNSITCNAVNVVGFKVFCQPAERC